MAIEVLPLHGDILRKASREAARALGTEPKMAHLSDWGIFTEVAGMRLLDAIHHIVGVEQGEIPPRSRTVASLSS